MWVCLLYESTRNMIKNHHGRVILGVLALSLLPLSLAAQGEMTAVGLASASEFSGSARFSALSGAMGAVGVEASSLVRNPAGISLLRGGNRLTLTLGALLPSYSHTWYNQNRSYSGENRYPVQEFAYQKGTDIANGGRVAFAFAVRRAGDFDHVTDASASLDRKHTSLADYMAGVTNNSEYDVSRRTGVPSFLPHKNVGASDAFSKTDIPWSSIFGFQGGWITSKDPKGGYYYPNFTYDNNGAYSTSGLVEGASVADLLLREKGNIIDYDFALGIEPSSTVHLGAVLTYSALDYESSLGYRDSFRGTDFLELRTRRSITGSGFRVGLGAIFEPTEGLRLGASVYTPTFYALKYDFYSEASSSINGKAKSVKSPSSAALAFLLRTPWRLGLNGAYVFGRNAILSVDYEYSIFGSTRLAEDTEREGDSESIYGVDNQRIKDHFTGMHTLRAGLEVMATPRLALRGGYRYSSSPMRSSFLRNGDYAASEAFVSALHTSYTMPGAINSLSAGLGYRITPSVSLDVAYVYGVQKSRTFAYPYIKDYGPVLDQTNPDVQSGKIKPEDMDGLAAIKETKTSHRAVATLTLRF